MNGCTFGALNAPANTCESGIAKSRSLSTPTQMLRGLDVSRYSQLRFLISPAFESQVARCQNLLAFLNLLEI